MQTKRYALTWEVGYTDCIDGQPERFVPAQVPGAVQLDWAKANGIEFPEYAGNPGDYRWMEDVFWLYRARLDFEPLARDERLALVCGGVDYHCLVRCAGILYEQEGMFTPIEVDLSASARPGELLEILVFPAPKSHTRADDRFQADQSVKPAVSYGWDFHPRLIPLGIWQETYLERGPACSLRAMETSYDLSADFQQANLVLAAGLRQPGDGWLRWLVLDPEGREILQKQARTTRKTITLNARIAAPRLWWPNGQGEQPLYTSRVELQDGQGNVIETRSQKLGFRKVGLIMHPGGWEDPELESFPKGRNRPPMTLEINGRMVFCKGSNWVSPDIFPGRIAEGTYHPLLKLARQSNLNMLRCWGGAIVQKDAFFNLCDELGIMIWQEFPLACARYEGTPGYLKVLDQESRSIIQRLKHHPAVVIWCGGNELFNSWSKMTDQDLAIRLLNRNTYDLDPSRPFLMTSPLHGMGHGGYTFRMMDGREVYQSFPTANRTAYTEFGVPGPASAKLLRRLIPKEELFPPKPGTSWEVRHGFKAWDGSADSWLELSTISHYFGEPKNLDELVSNGQLLQAEGLKFIFEEARRQKPTCGMALNWCFNEPWPTAANGSLVSWPAEAKPALSAVRRACRPVLVSARASKFTWEEGETFTAELYLLNDSPEPVPEGHVEAIIGMGEETFYLLGWDIMGAKANTNVRGPVVHFYLPALKTDRFRLVLRTDPATDWESSYTFLYQANPF